MDEEIGRPTTIDETHGSRFGVSGRRPTAAGASVLRTVIESWTPPNPSLQKRNATRLEPAP
jgi:hypothetical protein